jgi:hypothetical protein
MTALTALPPFCHSHLRWCTPDGLWLSDEEAAEWDALLPESTAVDGERAA